MFKEIVLQCIFQDIYEFSQIFCDHTGSMLTVALMVFSVYALVPTCWIGLLAIVTKFYLYSLNWEFTFQGNKYCILSSPLHLSSRHHNIVCHDLKGVSGSSQVADATVYKRIFSNLVAICSLKGVGTWSTCQICFNTNKNLLLPINAVYRPIKYSQWCTVTEGSTWRGQAGFVS